MLNNSNIYSDTMMPENPTYFKEDLVCETIVLPPENGDVERVLDIIVSPEIISLRVVNTVTGVSNEGQKLTGLKLIAEVLLKQKIIYVVDAPTQPVYALSYESLKSVAVIIPNDGTISPCTDLTNSSKINASAFVEGSSFRSLDSRSVYECILLFVDVKVC